MKNTEIGQGGPEVNAQVACAASQRALVTMNQTSRDWGEGSPTMATATFYDMQGCMETASSGVSSDGFVGFLSSNLLREAVNLKSNFLKRLYQESQ